MKTILILVLFAIPTFAQQPALTARQYFIELREANNFNKYYSKYVCFNDGDDQGFAVVSTTEDIIDAMTRNGDKAAAKAVAPHVARPVINVNPDERRRALLSTAGSFVEA